MEKLYTVLWSPEKKEWEAVKVEDLLRPPMGAVWSLFDNDFLAHGEAMSRNSRISRGNQPPVTD